MSEHDQYQWLKSSRRSIDSVDALSLTLTRRTAEYSGPSYFLPSFLPWDFRVVEVDSCWTLQLLLPWTLETTTHMSVYRRPVGTLDLFPDFQDIAQFVFPSGQSGFLKLVISTNAAWVYFSTDGILGNPNPSMVSLTSFSVFRCTWYNSRISCSYCCQTSS